APALGRSIAGAANGSAVATGGSRLFPANPLDQSLTYVSDYNNIQTGTAVDTGMTYSCLFDRIPNGTITSGTACTSLPSSVAVTFDTGTGAFSWTPNDAAWGAYEVEVTGTNGTGSGILKVTIDVRELYSPTNLIANYDAQFFNRIGPPATNPQTQWSDLTSNAYHSTISASLSSSWQGDGAGIPWHLSFDGSDTVTLALGAANTNLAAMSFGMWIRPDSPTATAKVILGNGGGTGNGFILRQSSDAKALGKVELDVGSTFSGTTVADLAPIHYWRLGDKAGLPYFNDDVGTSHGFSHGGVTFGVAGNFPDGDLAAAFDGTDDSVRIVDDTDFPIGTSARTMCAWAKPLDTSAGVRQIFNYGSAAGSQAMNIYQSGTTGAGGGYANDLTSASFFAAGTWKHICLTYDGTTARLYGNGSQVTSAAKTWNLVKSQAVIGRSVGGAEYFKGSIDEVALFNKELTADEVSALYLASYVRKYC
ncbi:MAG: LamG domain-containing protein, partial [Bdellovibrionota bacterium]